MDTYPPTVETEVFSTPEINVFPGIRKFATRKVQAHQIYSKWEDNKEKYKPKRERAIKTKEDILAQYDIKSNE